MGVGCALSDCSDGGFKPANELSANSVDVQGASTLVLVPVRRRVGPISFPSTAFFPAFPSIPCPGGPLPARLACSI